MVFLSNCSNKEQGIVYKGRGNLILALWRWIIYHKIPRANFARWRKTRRWTHRNQTTAVFMVLEQSLFLQDLLSIIWATLTNTKNKMDTTFFYSRAKVKVRQNKKENFILQCFKKSQFFLAGAAVVPNFL